MKIIKRSGQENTFDGSKIIIAVEKATKEVSEDLRLTDEQIGTIEKNVENVCGSMTRALSVEEIQDLVENELMKTGRYEVARKYITYRYKRALVRQANTTDDQILSLI